MAEVIKGSVSKVPQAKRMSKGVEWPWRVLAIDSRSGHHVYFGSFFSRKEASLYVDKHKSKLLAPVILNVDIPPMEY